jgi:hypothetical protein
MAPSERFLLHSWLRSVLSATLRGLCVCYLNVNCPSWGEILAARRATRTRCVDGQIYTIIEHATGANHR